MIRPTTAGPTWLQWGFHCLWTWIRRARWEIPQKEFRNHALDPKPEIYCLLSRNLEIEKKKTSKLFCWRPPVIPHYPLLFKNIYYIYLYICIVQVASIQCLELLAPNPKADCYWGHIISRTSHHRPLCCRHLPGSRCSHPVPVSPHARGRDPQCKGFGDGYRTLCRELPNSPSHIARIDEITSFTSFAQTHSPSNPMNLILSSPNGPQEFIGPTLYQVSIGGYWILGRWGWQKGKIPGVPQWESPWAWHTQSTQPLKCFAAIILCQKPTLWGSGQFGPQNALSETSGFA